MDKAVLSNCMLPTVSGKVFAGAVTSMESLRDCSRPALVHKVGLLPSFELLHNNNYNNKPTPILSHQSSSSVGLLALSFIHSVLLLL